MKILDLIPGFVLGNILSCLAQTKQSLMFLLVYSLFNVVRIIALLAPTDCPDFRRLRVLCIDVLGAGIATYMFSLVSRVKDLAEVSSVLALALVLCYDCMMLFKYEWALQSFPAFLQPVATQKLDEF